MNVRTRCLSTQSGKSERVNTTRVQRDKYSKRVRFNIEVVDKGVGGVIVRYLTRANKVHTHTHYRASSISRVVCSVHCRRTTIFHLRGSVSAPRPTERTRSYFTNVPEQTRDGGRAENRYRPSAIRAAGTHGRRRTFIGRATGARNSRKRAARAVNVRNGATLLETLCADRGPRVPFARARVNTIIHIRPLSSPFDYYNAPD